MMCWGAVRRHWSVRRAQVVGKRWAAATDVRHMGTTVVGADRDAGRSCCTCPGTVHEALQGPSHGEALHCPWRTLDMGHRTPFWRGIPPPAGPTDLDLGETTMSMHVYCGPWGGMGWTGMCHGTLGHALLWSGVQNACV